MKTRIIGSIMFFGFCVPVWAGSFPVPPNGNVPVPNINVPTKPALPKPILPKMQAVPPKGPMSVGTDGRPVQASQFSTGGGMAGQKYVSYPGSRQAIKNINAGPVVVTPAPVSQKIESIAKRPALPSIEIIVPGNPYVQLNEFKKAVLQNPSGSFGVISDGNENPEILDSAKGTWEKANFTGLGVVEAKMLKAKTYIRVSNVLAKQAIPVFAKGMTHMFRCGGDTCFALENSTLKVEK